MRVLMSEIDFQVPTIGGRIVQILDGVTLAIASGEVHALLGPNGCGKTTLLRIIAGLDGPTAGSVDFAGERRHPNMSAFIFQDPTLLPWWSVERNISASAEFAGRDRAIIERVRDFYLHRVGLSRFRRSTPDQLSRGMQTKAAMGRALAHDASVLLLDEPFAHLDALSRLKMQEDLETHWHLDPRTLILVTHDVEEAVQLADRISVMSPAPGRIVGTVDVDMPRPRTQSARHHPGFRAAVGHVWDLLGGHR